MLMLLMIESWKYEKGKTGILSGMMFIPSFTRICSVYVNNMDFCSWISVMEGRNFSIRLRRRNHRSLSEPLKKTADKYFLQICLLYTSGPPNIFWVTPQGKFSRDAYDKPHSFTSNSFISLSAAKECRQCDLNYAFALKRGRFWCTTRSVSML
jgi:hypothetical protein